jgi:hypothetical protein
MSWLIADDTVASGLHHARGGGLEDEYWLLSVVRCERPHCGVALWAGREESGEVVESLGESFSNVLGIIE